MGLNNSLNDLRKEIVELINKSQVPVGVVYYIIKDVYRDIEIAYETAVLNELKEQAIKESKEQKEDIEISEEN